MSDDRLNAPLPDLEDLSLDDMLDGMFAQVAPDFLSMNLKTGKPLRIKFPNTDEDRKMVGPVFQRLVNDGVTRKLVEKTEKYFLVEIVPGENSKIERLSSPDATILNKYLIRDTQSSLIDNPDHVGITATKEELLTAKNEVLAARSISSNPPAEMAAATQTAVSAATEVTAVTVAVTEAEDELIIVEDDDIVYEFEDEDPKTK